MLLCRRLLFTADPQYPAVTFFAKLPSLVLHINEHKVRDWNWLCPRKVFQQDFQMRILLILCVMLGFLLYLVSRVQVFDLITVHF